MHNKDLNDNKSPAILITGGSGLVGRYLTSMLLSEGYKVSHLSRNTNQFGRVRVHRWDPEKNVLDPVVLEGIDFIIHLAGANIGEKRWTTKRKKEIISSRVDSAKLIYKVVTENKISLKGFISASAIGYYGSLTSEHIYTEIDPPADDFLGRTCRLWEDAADLFETSGIRTVKIRTAVVLEKSDAALAKLLRASKLGFFPQLGSGKQFMPWIHIIDLCRIYLMAIKDSSMRGPYNACAPDHTDSQTFIRTLARIMKKPLFFPPVPSLLLRLVMGESSAIALEGSRISSEKIINQGFRFEFSNLELALSEILKH